MKPINLKTPGLHHLALRTADLARSRAFYHELLGFNVLMEVDGLIILSAGSFVFALRAPDSATPAGDIFSPFRVGLDHLAFAATDPGEVDRVAALLKENGIWIDGPKTDPALGKYYVAFKDPDGIKWEYYMA